jgi:type IV secretory pathway VirJ component
MTIRRTVLVGVLAAGTLAVAAVAMQTPQTAPPPKAAPSAPQVAQPAPPPASAPWTEETIEVPILGKVTAYVPKRPVTHVVLFLSGDGGWNLGVIDMARRIQPKAIVIGVSYVALRKASGTGPRCWMPAGDLEEIAHAAEKTLKLPDYYPPILVGYSSGATLVYGALATAPPQTFSGGLSLGFCPDLPSNRPVCDAEGFKPTFDATKNTAWLPKVKGLPREFYALNGEQDQVCLPPQMHEFLDGVKGVHFVEIPGTGHGFSRPIRWGEPFDQAIDALLAEKTGETGRRPVAAAATAAMEHQLDALNLPLEYRWAESARASVIFVSGDGGWATLDDKLALYLSSHGVNVVGVSAIRYFWTKKTPQQAGADTYRVAEVLGNARLPIFLGGYSFGAEVTPFILENWPAAERLKVRGQLLIAPGETASFEVSPLDWVFRAKATPERVADAVRRVGVPAFCLAGEKEEAGDTACDDLATAAVAVRLPGSHHFNGNYDAVGKAVLEFIEKQLGSHLAS